MAEFDEKENAKRNYTSKIKNDNLLALQKQMEERRLRMADEDKLNMNEANINNYIGTNVDYKHPSEIYGYGVPGLGMSFERKRQLGMIDRNLDFTKTLNSQNEAARGEYSAAQNAGQQVVGGGNVQTTITQTVDEPQKITQGEAIQGQASGANIQANIERQEGGQGSYGYEQRSSQQNFNAQGGDYGYQQRTSQQNFGGQAQYAAQRNGGYASQSMEGLAMRQPRTDYDYIKLKNSAWGNKFDIISNKLKDFAK